MEINTLIEQFKSLDLSKYPKDEILSLFRQAGDIGYVIVTFHRGKSVMRARPNSNGERFEKRSNYSYKPQQYNKTYQRASTPNQTMFYATTIPENLQPGELNNMRVIGVAETVPMLRDATKSGIQKISFGRWYVHEDIHMLAIVQKDKYYQESSYTRELADAYSRFIKSNSAEVVERSLAFTSFLADEFAKEKIRDDYDYMISALFTELVINKGLDGVLYPSVRVGGRGFNIAITPEATSKLGLYVAGECSIYKNKGRAAIDNDAIVELGGTEDEFKLVELEKHEQECLRIIGVNSIDDLK
ncbi:RES family NAD+ phosphorylase [Hymenobacter sp. NST-14]|uniref:RES family NAD+ phosphorylase n=1 Tax=Hymenobacter piscis TaxID=2839984 RepID=UPI001C00CA25|nr:RES family NAD+ phosphorylase [Hymenobacter piscis]MBT9394815.1 RES family NAD+ phosphorylase [Hymenobacter piscis]